MDKKYIYNKISVRDGYVKDGKWDGGGGARGGG